MSIRRISIQAGSVQSSTLLTPPETPTTPKDAPFKPQDGDKISLSMKRHHQQASEDLIPQPRACLSHDELRGLHAAHQSPQYLHYAKSMPILEGPKTYPMFKPVVATQATGPGCPDQRRRRWTLPSKAAPIKGTAQEVSALSISTSITKMRNTNDLDSPAMITLRRATHNQSARKMSLTFFPEPQFHRTKSGLLSYFLNTISNSETKSPPAASGEDGSQTRRSSSSATVENGSAQPSGAESAPSVRTEVTGIQPRLLIPGQVSAGLPVRRCSTRFISNGLVYEVIWDENGSSTTSESPPSQPEPAVAGRRRSVAIEQLECQLSKAAARTRRESQASQEALSRKSTIANDDFKARSPSLAEFVNFKFAALANDGALQDLPRLKSFKSGRAGSLAPPLISMVPEESSALEADDTTRGLGFFPPLRSRAKTGGSMKNSMVVNPVETGSIHSMASPQGACSRKLSQSGGIGNLVGISTHMRRRSNMLDDWVARQRANAVNRISSRRNSTRILPTTRGTGDNDTMPLLSSVGMLE